MNSLIILASYERFLSAGNIATLENILGMNSLREAVWVEIQGPMGYIIIDADLEMKKEMRMGLKLPSLTG